VNAADPLRRELARPGYVPESIAIGVNTGAYQCELDFQLVPALEGGCRGYHQRVTEL